MKKAAYGLIRGPVKHEDTYFAKAYLSKALKVQFGKTPKEYECIFQPPRLTANPNSWHFPFPNMLNIPLGPATALFCL